MCIILKSFLTSLFSLVIKAGTENRYSPDANFGCNRRFGPARPNSPTAMSPRMNSPENITATGLGRFVQILNKTGDQHFLCYRTILR